MLLFKTIVLLVVLFFSSYYQAHSRGSVRYVTSNFSMFSGAL